MKLLYLLLISFLLTLSSCATILKSKTEEITFVSNPPGASVFINDYKICETPCTAEVEKSAHYVEATMKLKGYKDEVFELERKFDAVSLLNSDGLAGWLIDYDSGAIMKYTTKEYSLTLEPIDSLSSE